MDVKPDDYDKGIEAWVMGYSFDPELQSVEFMEGYFEAERCYWDNLDMPGGFF